jgi:hypothetical protein
MLSPRRLSRMTEAFRAHGFNADVDKVTVHELASVANCYVVGARLHARRSVTDALAHVG